MVGLHEARDTVTPKEEDKPPRLSSTNTNMPQHENPVYFQKLDSSQRVKIKHFREILLTLSSQRHVLPGLPSKCAVREFSLVIAWLTWRGWGGGVRHRETPADQAQAGPPSSPPVTRDTGQPSGLMLIPQLC